MYKIAMLGEKDTVIGFTALGLDVFPVETEDQAREQFHTLSRPESDYAIIYLSETYYTLLQDEVEKCKHCITPAVILIPGSGGSLGLGQSALDSAVERAIGTSIL